MGHIGRKRVVAIRLQNLLGGDKNKEVLYRQRISAAN